MNYIIEGTGALVNEKGEEQPLKAGDFALVNPEGLANQPGREAPIPQQGGLAIQNDLRRAEGVRVNELSKN